MPSPPIIASTSGRCPGAGGVEAAAYHAGIDNRSEIQERFMRGDVRVMAAATFDLLRNVAGGAVPGSG